MLLRPAVLVPVALAALISPVLTVFFTSVAQKLGSFVLLLSFLTVKIGAEWLHTTNPKQHTLWKVCAFSSLSFLISSYVSRDALLQILLLLTSGGAYYNALHTINFAGKQVTKVISKGPKGYLEVSQSKKRRTGWLATGETVIIVAVCSTLCSMHILTGYGQLASFLFFAAITTRLVGGYLIHGVYPLTLSGGMQFQMLQIVGYCASLTLPLDVGQCGSVEIKTQCQNAIIICQAFSFGCMMMALGSFRRMSKNEFKAPSISERLWALIVTALPIGIAAAAVIEEESQVLVRSLLVCILPFVWINGVLLLGLTRTFTTLTFVGLGYRPIGSFANACGWMCYTFSVVSFLQDTVDFKVVGIAGLVSWCFFSIALLSRHAEPVPVHEFTEQSGKVMTLTLNLGLLTTAIYADSFNFKQSQYAVGILALATTLHTHHIVPVRPLSMLGKLINFSAYCLFAVGCVPLMDHKLASSAAFFIASQVVFVVSTWFESIPVRPTSKQSTKKMHETVVVAPVVSDPVEIDPVEIESVVLEPVREVVGVVEESPRDVQEPMAEPEVGTLSSSQQPMNETPKATQEYNFNFDVDVANDDITDTHSEASDAETQGSTDANPGQQDIPEGTTEVHETHAAEGEPMLSDVEQEDFAVVGSSGYEACDDDEASQVESEVPSYTSLQSSSHDPEQETNPHLEEVVQEIVRSVMDDAIKNVIELQLDAEEKESRASKPEGQRQTSLHGAEEFDNEFTVAAEQRSDASTVEALSESEHEADHNDEVQTSDLSAAVAAAEAYAAELQKSITTGVSEETSQQEPQQVSSEDEEPDVEPGQANDTTKIMEQHSDSETACSCSECEAHSEGGKLSSHHDNESAFEYSTSQSDSSSDTEGETATYNTAPLPVAKRIRPVLPPRKYVHR